MFQGNTDLLPVQIPTNSSAKTEVNLPPNPANQPVIPEHPSSKDCSLDL
jgi:hypothetical protein